MKNIKNYIYKIITSGGSGTGFKVKGHDFVITNYHVVEGSKEVAVEDQNNNRFLAKVVMVNPEVDLAFLNVPDLINVHSEIELNANYQVAELQKVTINGFPFGMPFTITEGIISSANQQMHGRNYVQTDAAVNPGNSGGPMLDKNGILVGVTTSKFTQADNVGFGIKHSDVIKEINDYKFTDSVYRVKCDSCDNYIIEETEFCPHCGNAVTQSVFEVAELSHFAKFTEQALSEMDNHPVLCRAGRDYWEFHQGSALVRIFIVNNNYLFATSPLNELPKENLNELLSYINSNPTPPYQLGIYENKIFISYRTHLSDIYSPLKETIKENLKGLILKADEMDDYLHDQFECEMSLESKTIETNMVSDIQSSVNNDADLSSNTDDKKDILVEKLRKLKNLFEIDLITEEEYIEKKKALLNDLI